VLQQVLGRCSCDGGGQGGMGSRRALRIVQRRRGL
jgi:hypothetical protein